jgi:hypothetical protein
MIRSGFERTGIALPAMLCDDSCHDLECGASMCGMITDAEPKQPTMADERSDNDSEIGLRSSGLGGLPVSVDLGWATTKTLETFHTLDLPYPINAYGPVSRVGVSPALGRLFQLDLPDVRYPQGKGSRGRPVEFRVLIH